MRPNYNTKSMISIFSYSNSFSKPISATSFLLNLIICNLFFFWFSSCGPHLSSLPPHGSCTHSNLPTPRQSTVLWLPGYLQCIPSDVNIQAVFCITSLLCLYPVLVRPPASDFWPGKDLCFSCFTSYFETGNHFPFPLRTYLFQSQSPSFTSVRYSTSKF